MNSDKREKKESIRKIAQGYLMLVTLFLALAFFAEIKVDSNIWPITSNYFFPNFCILCAYIFMAFFLILVVTWIIRGDHSER